MISAAAGPSSSFLSVFYLFNHTTTCSPARGGAAADEPAGGGGLRRKKGLFHCGLLWEHVAPLMSERKTSGGGIEEMKAEDIMKDIHRLQKWFLVLVAQFLPPPPSPHSLI